MFFSGRRRQESFPIRPWGLGNVGIWECWLGNLVKRKRGRRLSWTTTCRKTCEPQQEPWCGWSLFPPAVDLLFQGMVHSYPLPVHPCPWKAPRIARLLGRWRGRERRMVLIWFYNFRTYLQHNHFLRKRKRKYLKYVNCKIAPAFRSIKVRKWVF